MEDAKFVSSWLNLSYPLPACMWGIARLPWMRRCCFTCTSVSVVCAIPSQVDWWLVSGGIQEDPLPKYFRIHKTSFPKGIQTVLKCELDMELCLTVVQGGSRAMRVDDTNCCFLRRGMWQGVNGVSASSCLRGFPRILPVSCLKSKINLWRKLHLYINAGKSLV